MEEKDLNITLIDNNLVLEGERKSAQKKEDEGNFFSEFKYGSFYRSIPMDEDVDSNNVSAVYKNGVLNIELKKLKPSTSKQKRIQIKH
jgi:HSP20 family protein